MNTMSTLPSLMKQHKFALYNCTREITRDAVPHGLVFFLFDYYHSISIQISSFFFFFVLLY